MKNRSALLIPGAILLFIFIFTSCKKINEATELGGDLIPAVDNVTTFDTTLSVETYNDLFTDLTDSTRLTGASIFFAGAINNDPLFGKTTAIPYFQLKPTFYPFTFDFPHKDSVTQIDSVVLVMGYTHTYGDSNTAMNFNVYSIDPISPFSKDSVYLIRSNTFTLGSLIGSRSGIIPSSLDDSIYAFQDTTAYQMRIKLNPIFGQQMLLNYDTTNAYKSDSLLNTYFKGFAVVPSSASSNALVGIDLSSTKLAFYYHYKNGAITDTAIVSYFTYNGFCGSANLIQRNYSGSQLATYQGGASPDDLVFLQNTPGSFAKVIIPGLKTLSNRIVHRAELIMEEVYDPSDQTFATPDYLFLDAYDTTKKLYRTIPYDFTIDGNGNYNATTFGMIGQSSMDGIGNPIKVWKFNITRYVQNMLTKKEPYYEFRVSTPFSAAELFRVGGIDVSPSPVFPINRTVAEGRVRLGGGNHATQRMRLRIIYTKI